jgi:uncharacterized SAM-binding protein YcdF (DUF218 family)
MFGWVAFGQVVGNLLATLWWEHAAPWAGLAAAALSLSRLRGVVWASGLLLCAAYLVVAYSPLAGIGIRTLVQRDPLQQVDAVVVLSSSLSRDGELSEMALQRVLHGVELVHAGYAPRLVLTRLPAPWTSSVPAVRRQMAAFGLDFPIIETPIVGNTHDEALAVAALVKQHGWRRMALVTHPFHMRRAAAVFEHAGVPVLRAPCKERTYLETAPYGPEENLAAFRHWLHEAIGLAVYRARGWI